MEFNIYRFMKCLYIGKEDATEYLKTHPTNELNFPSFLTIGVTYNSLEVLSEILKTDNTVTTVSFRGSYINDKVVEIIAEALKANKTITKLDLSNNNFLSNSKSDSESVSESDSELDSELDSKSVSKLDSKAKSLVTSKSGKSIELMLMHNSTLKELNLSQTGLGDKEITEISKGLRCNKTLEILDLSRNNIGKGAANIATAIQNRGKNCDLDLSCNEMTDKEAMALSTMLKKCGGKLKFNNNPKITKVGEKILFSQLQKNGNMPDMREYVNEEDPSKVQGWCDRLSKQENNLDKKSGGRS